jgi:tetratricopeptide (TPR) repeat protein
VSPGALLTALLLLDAPGPGRAEAPCPAVPPGLADVEVAERAEAEFGEGVRLRQAADKARPHFRAAAAYFDELRRRGARNAMLYRNLGNAYLLAGDLPHAILSYHRGLRLAPRDRALRDNLEQARALVSYPPGSNFGRPAADPTPLWLPRLGPGWLLAAAALLYALAWVFLTRWLMVRRGRLQALGLAAVLAAGLATGGLIVIYRVDEGEAARPLVVVLDDGVLLRKGDGLTYPPRYDTPLNRGAEARRLFERGAWLQVELAGGEVGWVPRQYVLEDTPD